MKIVKARLIVILGILILCFGVLIGRLFSIQILNGDRYAVRCREQSKLRKIIMARRGCIRDRNGHILAKSIASQVPLEITLHTSSDGEEASHKEKSLCRAAVKRIYPYGELAAPVLGYVGTDGNGLAGVEYVFDQYLRGENGWSIIQKDGRNHRYSRIGMPQKIPQDGADIYLTIDLPMQKIAEKVLEETVRARKAKGGMCIVMDPVSGDILAMANAPTFDPNIWNRYPSSCRINRCIAYNYEPGSTFKVVTAAAALQESVKKEDDIIDGNQGVFKIYDQTILDHKAFGKITFADALSYSSNVCFAKIANELGNDRLYKYTRNFGLGATSGIGLPGEEAGIVHPVKKWSGRTRVTMAIGQEVSVTFLQMMVAFSAVANGGILIEPHIFSRIVDDKESIMKKQTEKAKRRVISEAIASRLRAMMKGVVEYGTAKRCTLPGLSIAGKTGTSQKIDTETGTYSKEKVWASFIGFAPVDHPVLVCGVVIDEPLQGGGGGVVAVPAFRQIMRQIISHPDLEFAEKLLNTDVYDSTAVKAMTATAQSEKNVPDICGMERREAARFLSAEDIRFEIIGTGKQIAYQSPGKGTVYTKDSKLILYTGDPNPRKTVSSVPDDQIRIPNCVGKDLRDAVNALNLKGLVPYVKGAGIVQRQVPSFGSMVHSTVICTLVCSFEG